MCSQSSKSVITRNYAVVPVYWLCFPSLPSVDQILLALEVQDGDNPGTVLHFRILSLSCSPAWCCSLLSQTLFQPGQPYSSVVWSPFSSISVFCGAKLVERPPSLADKKIRIAWHLNVKN